MDTNPINHSVLPTSPPRVIEGEARPIAGTPIAGISQPDALHLFTCLLVGGGIELTELLLAHARTWQARFDASPKLLPWPEEESAADLLRYALIGLIFDTEQQLRQNAAWWGNHIVRSGETATAVTRVMTDNWLFAPLRRPFRSLSVRLQSDLSRLVYRGRTEETISRIMATELTDEMISVLLDYLSNKPEVRRLIQEQGTSLAGEVVDEVRNQSEAADNFVESLVRRLLGQSRPDSSPPPASTT
jgi:hypothetical protein